METLYEKLATYGESDFYPFHMPGHKRRMGIMEPSFRRDITEIHGFDNLHHSQGIIKSAQEKAANLYGAQETKFLINGSTAGILSAIFGCTSQGGKILMARNCHHSVYHAVYLRRLHPIYVYPEMEENFGINGGICPDQIKEILEREKVEAVILTSPTYEGVVSDIGKIAEIVHKQGIPLIIDEAHGAHFKFHSYFPISSLDCGADIVIQSLHKTLPSFTQTALLHLNGRFGDRERIKWYLKVFQTSSPSYLFMGGIDQCVNLLEREGNQLFERYVTQLEELREQLSGNHNISLGLGKHLIGSQGIYDVDLSKLILSVRGRNMTGEALGNIFRKNYHLEMELYAWDYCLAMTSIGDDREGYERLIKAVREMDSMPELKQDCFVDKLIGRAWDGGQLAMLPGETEERARRSVLLEESEGLISAEYIYLYPPGIPFLVPGEIITNNILKILLKYKEKGFRIEGLEDFSNRTIQVIC